MYHISFTNYCSLNPALLSYSYYACQAFCFGIKNNGLLGYIYNNESEIWYRRKQTDAFLSLNDDFRKQIWSVVAIYR